MAASDATTMLPLTDEQLDTELLTLREEAKRLYVRLRGLRQHLDGQGNRPHTRVAVGVAVAHAYGTLEYLGTARRRLAAETPDAS